jgi:hypothetical protein
MVEVSEKTGTTTVTGVERIDVSKCGLIYNFYREEPG